MDISKLEPGPELDALIAEKVIGMFGPGLKTIEGMRSIPHYSRDIAAAWKVVEFLRARGFDLDSFSCATKSQAGWSDAIFMSEHRSDEFVARAKTFPLAICQAALLATEKTQ